MATFHANLVQSFKNFKNKYIGNTSIADIGDGTLTGAVAQIKSDLTWEYTNTSIAYITDTNSHTIDISGYKSLKINGHFPNGGMGTILISCDELKAASDLSSSVFAEWGYDSGYGGIISFTITPTSFKINKIIKGSGIGVPYVTVLGLK